MPQTSFQIESPSPATSSRERAGAVRVLIALAVCASVASAVSGVRSGGWVHADPLSIDSNGSSTLILAAPSTAGVSAEVGARPFGGGSIESVERYVPAMGVSTLDLGSELALSPGIISLSADGDGPLAALGRTYWPEAGGALTTHGAPGASTDLILPLAEYFRRGLTTYVAILNTDTGSSATVEVSAIKTQESRIGASGELTIPAGASAGFWLGEGPLRDLSEDWVGAITIRSDRPVAAIAWVSDEDGGPAVFDVLAVPLDRAASEWHLPTIRSRRTIGDGVGPSASSRIAIANPSDRIAVLVTADLVGRAGACAGSTFTSATKTVRAGSMIVMDLGPDPDRADYAFEVPADCEGSVRVYTSLGEVVVSEVEETWQGVGRRVGASGAPAHPSDRPVSHVLAPWRLSGGDAPQHGRELSAVNASAADVTIAVRLHAADGSVEACSDCSASLGPMESVLWTDDELMLSNGEAPESVELVADGPIAAVVDDRADDLSGDHARFAVPAIDGGASVSGVEHHPLLLANARLAVAPRAPTPTPYPTPTPFPTVDPGPGPGPRPTSPPRPTVPMTPPTAIPSRTPSPTPTEVPTEVPLGDIVLQNLDSTARSLNLELIAGDGSTAARVDRPGVAASAAGVVDISTLADRLGAEPHGGIAGGATDLGALVINRAARGAIAAYMAPAVAETVIIPAAYVDFGGRTTAFGVQNASADRVVRVDVELVPYGRESFTRRATIELPPGANRTYRLGVSTDFVAVPAPPEGFSGWLRLVADGPIAAAADVTRSDRPRAAWTVRGAAVGEASDRHLVPAVHAGSDGLTTSLHLFNPGVDAIEAQIEYRGASAACPDVSTSSAPVSVPGFTGVVVLPPEDGSLSAAGCSAVAEVAADGALIVDAAIHRADEDASAGFPAVAESSAAGRVALPRVALDDAGTWSRIFVANTDPSAVEVDVRLFDAGGGALACGAACTLNVPGRGGAVLDLAGLDGLPSGIASAEVLANAPIIVVALDVPTSSDLDLSAYTAVDTSRSAAPRALPLVNWTVRPGFVVGPTPTATPWPTSTIGPTPTPFTRPTIGPAPSPGLPRTATPPGPGFDRPFDIIGAQNLDSAGSAIVGAQLFAERAASADTVAMVPADPWALTAIDGRLGPIAPDRRAAWIMSDRSVAPWAMHGLESGAVFGHLGAAPGRELVVPLLMAGLIDQWSTLVVQGAGDGLGTAGGVARTSVKIEFFAAGSDSTEPSLVIDEVVTAGGFVSVAMTDVVDMIAAADLDTSASHFAARITADGPVAALSVAEHADGWAYDVAGTPIERASERLLIPVIRSNVDRDNSGVLLFNPNPEPATVRMTYQGFAGMCAGRRYPVTAPITIDGMRHRGINYLPGPDHPLPSGCEASMIVESDRPLVGVVNSVTGYNEAVLAYAASAPMEAAEAVGIPRVHVGDFRRTTTLYVMHAGDDGATYKASVTLIDGAGRRMTCELCTLSLEPGATARIDLSAERAFAGFVGSAMIESTGPVIAVAIDKADGMRIDPEGKEVAAGDSAAWRGAPASGPFLPSVKAPQLLPIAVWAWLSGSPDPTPTPFVRPTPSFDPVGVVHLPHVVSNAAGLEPESTAVARPRPTATPPTPTRGVGGSSAESIWP